MNQTSVSNISVIVNSKIGLLRDNVDHSINDFELWLNQIINQTRKESLVRKDICEICNSKEDCFEGHHLAGRKHDYRQITACKLCHDELSMMQKIWDTQWLEYQPSENLKQAFFLQGLQDILILKSKKSGNSLYEKLATSFIEDISHGLKA